MTTLFNTQRAILESIDENAQTKSFDAALMGLDVTPVRSRVRTPALVVVSGQAVGKLFKISEGEMTLGRANNAQILLPDEGISRLHAKITWKDNKFWIVDLGSTNGTFVNNQKVLGPTALQEGDCIRIGLSVLLRLGFRDELDEQLQAELYELATRDPLTQAYNRRHFEACLVAEWAWAKRHSKPCALCAIDADHFKRINDKYGHPAGDFVLRELSRVVQLTVRAEDVFARVGGEEFLLLARATERGAAMVLGNRICTAIARHAFVYEGEKLSVTVSVGVCTSAEPSVTKPADLIAQADTALYQAKQEGRNRVKEAVG